MAETNNKNGWDWKKELRTNKYMGDIQRKIIERLHNPSYVPFKLDKEFVDKYTKIKPPFGFGGFGELVYMRTYSRIKPDGSNEQWPDTIERVVNGTYNLQKRWIEKSGLEWQDYKAQESAQEMYERMFNMKFLPPGRGLWAMGSEITEERGLYAALNNCGFTSTENIKEDLSKPFKFLMDMSMIGVGVGFDTKGAGKIIVKGPDTRRNIEKFIIPDTREGWVESVGRLIDSYFLNINPVEFDYHQIRKNNEIIHGFGGKSSGPEPLIKTHEDIRKVLEREKGGTLTSRAIVDMQNLIGRCVVAGNVRRTAEIALGNLNDEVFLDLKNYQRNPERVNYGWTSNNSIFADIGMDYSGIVERIIKNGEPGLVWLENMRGFGRMADPRNGKDSKVMGCNPCVEQSLENKELCNLVENFPNNHESKEDFLRTLKFSYMYSKTTSLGETHWPDTNQVLLRNRRIGCSISGVQQFIAKHGLDTLKDWLNSGFETIQHYDEVYSNWMAVPNSIKTTSVKPSGTISSLVGATPGMHWPTSEYYVRRMRLSKNSELIAPLQEAGYKLKKDTDDVNSLIVEFPVHVGEGIKSEQEISLWEQLEMVSFLQKYWSDNQVSSTIKFNPDLNYNEQQELKILNGRRKSWNKNSLEIISQYSERKKNPLVEKSRRMTKALNIVNKLESNFENLRLERKNLLERIKEEYRIFTPLDSGRITYLENKDSVSETKQIEPALNHFQDRIKGISFLPKDDTLYNNPPFSPISKDEYFERSRVLKPIDFSDVKNEKAEIDKFCSNDVCDLNAEIGTIKANQSKPL